MLCCEHWGTSISLNLCFWLVFIFFYIPMSGIAGSYGSSILRNFLIVFHSDCINVHQQLKVVPFPPHPQQHVWFVFFWWWSFWQVWGDSSLRLWFAFPRCLVMLGHLFTCLMANGAPLWKNVHSVLCPFFNQAVFLMLSCMNCLWMLHINP